MKTNQRSLPELSTAELGDVRGGGLVPVGWQPGDPTPADTIVDRIRTGRPYNIPVRPTK